MGRTRTIRPRRRGTSGPPRDRAGANARARGRARVGATGLLAALALALAPTTPAHAIPGRPSTAALQVALHAEGTYAGSIDGLRGPGTAAAVRTFQRRHGLAADGIAGPRTRTALGIRGRPRLGRRPLTPGARGWDVAALQFLLARAGFPSGSVDGGFGARTAAAVSRFQARAGLTPDGLAGPATLQALKRPSPASPIRLARPVDAAVGDRYGMRGARLHAGLDFPAPTGAPVTAATVGSVVTVGWDGGWGRYVVLQHVAGVRTLYAHLSSVALADGARVGTGTTIGAVGATGAATGPHLHFEVFSRGANVDPLPALVG